MSEENDSNGTYRFSVEFWPPKILIEGDDKDWVEQMAEKHLPSVVEVTRRLPQNFDERVEKPATEDLNQLPLFADINADTRQSENALMPEKQNGSKKESTMSQNLTLNEFYHKLTIKDQYEEVAAITFWYKNYGNKDVLTFEDFWIAYDELQFENVDKPDDRGLRNRLNNCRRRKGYIIAPEPGKFALARKGKDLVRELISKSEMTDNI